jgi:predicted amidohydrolase
VNRTGVDGTGITYCGDSMMIDSRGAILCNMKSQSEGTATTTLSLDELINFRRKFPVIRDEDIFEISL